MADAVTSHNSFKMVHRKAIMKLTNVSPMGLVNQQLTKVDVSVL
jgi:hypothetical protein